MKLHDADREKPFLAQFDFKLPYQDHACCTAIIGEARTISLNAQFCVLNEIARPPYSGLVDRDRQLALRAEWVAGVEHELISPLILCADALIKGRTLPWADVVDVMKLVATFEGQRAALLIAYSSGDCSMAEGNAALDAADKRIREAWDKNGV